MRHLPVLITILLLASCAPRHPEDMRRIEDLRSDARALLQAQARMGFESWAYGTQSNQDSLYRAHASLFTREHIDLVRRAEEDEEDPVQKKRLRYFHRYLVLETIAKEVAPLTDRMVNMEAAASVSIGREQVPYRRLSSLLANERDQRKREELFNAADPVLDSLNMTARQIEEIYRQRARDFGYDSYTGMIAALKEFSLADLGATAAALLTATDSLYEALLREQLASGIGLSRERFRPYDTPALFRSARFDKYFPAAGLLATVKETYRGLGIDMDAEANLTIDAEDRPAKNPRAVCYAVVVPDDIRLSIKPIGGLDDYAALFHEMGHGQHYANTRERALEFGYLGEPTVTETFAFLSEYILTDQAWLRLRTEMPVPLIKELIRHQTFLRMLYVRRYAAKVLYELQLHDGAAHPESLYTSLQSRAVGWTPVPSVGRRYLVDVDANYYSASYLRAWFLEAQLNAHLASTYGSNWFEHPDAGRFLRELWAGGDKLNGEELVRLIGRSTISPDDWIQEIRLMVLFSTP